MAPRLLRDAASSFAVIMLPLNLGVLRVSMLQTSAVAAAIAIAYLSVAMTAVDTPANNGMPLSRAAPSFACDSSKAYRSDIDTAISAIEKRYVYLPDKKVDWSRAALLARREVETVRSKRDFVGVLEPLLDNLYDPHATLKANTTHSPRLVPSGLDLWAEWRGTTAVVTAVRPDYSADQAGIRPEMIVTMVNGVPTHEAAAARLGPAVQRPAPPDAFAWALLSALAGRHDVPRTLRVRDASGQEKDVVLDLPQHRRVDDPSHEPLLETHTIVFRGNESTDSTVYGYVRLNALADIATVPAFDSALATLRGTRGLILDLRNTPGGGSTDVAEPILGRFIARAAGYQRVAPSNGQAYARIVHPRGPWRYSAPLVVLVGRWTGSMGEGMAIGLDGMHRAVVIGTRMAGLAGAVDDLTLPCTGLTLAFPTVRLLHMNGTPRERWSPPVLVDFSGPALGDRVLYCGITLLRGLASERRASCPYATDTTMRGAGAGTTRRDSAVARHYIPHLSEW